MCQIFTIKQNLIKSIDKCHKNAYNIAADDDKVIKYKYTSVARTLERREMIYLLRHGLDDERYIGGWSDVELTKKGIMQVEKVSKYIKDNLPIKTIYSSDIKRAKQTTSIVNSYLNVKVIYTEDLRELNKGLLTGMDYNEANIKYNDLLKNLTVYTKYPSGESMYDLYIRVKENLNKSNNLDNCLLITHRGIINMLYYILNDIELDLNKERFSVTHASIHELDLSKKLIKKIK